VAWITNFKVRLGKDPQIWYGPKKKGRGGGASQENVGRYAGPIEAFPRRPPALRLRERRKPEPPGRQSKGGAGSKESKNNKPTRKLLLKGFRSKGNEPAIVNQSATY